MLRPTSNSSVRQHQLEGQGLQELQTRHPHALQLRRVPRLQAVPSPFVCPLHSPSAEALCCVIKEHQLQSQLLLFQLPACLGKVAALLTAAGERGRTGGIMRHQSQVPRLPVLFKVGINH